MAWKSCQSTVEGIKLVKNYAQMKVTETCQAEGSI